MTSIDMMRRRGDMHEATPVTVVGFVANNGPDDFTRRGIDTPIVAIYIDKDGRLGRCKISELEMPEPPKPDIYPALIRFIAILSCAALIAAILLKVGPWQ